MPATSDIAQLDTDAAPPQPAPPPGPPPPQAADPLPAPPAMPPQQEPLLRRPVELSPVAGLALPACKAGEQSDDRCEGVGAGLGVGLSAFWRVTPHIAWGGELSLAGFRHHPPDHLQYHDAQAAAVWLMLLGRLYFLDEGSVDPYLQLGLGGGALGTTVRIRSGETFEETGAGPAVQIGGGIDFYLNRSLRLGPSLTYTRVFVDKIRRCQAGGSGDCQDIDRDADGHLNAVAILGVRLTIMLGEEL